MSEAISAPKTSRDRWALRIAGAAYLLFVVGYIVTRPERTTSAESGGFVVNGRLCNYEVTDGRITKVIAFDRNYLTESSAGTWGNTETSFELRDGRRFRMLYPNRDALEIDGTTYNLQAGRVMLITLGEAKNHIRQLDITFEGVTIPFPSNGEDVRQELLKVAASSPELAAFLNERQKP